MTVELVPAELAADEHVVANLVGIVNRAYLTAEEGMWTRGLTRTNPQELAEAITKGEVAAVRVDGELAGAVFTHLLDERTGWFGALAVEPSFAGRGLGGQLVEFAEEHARRYGADTMQLELLVPDPPHPHTRRLAEWYAALGYRHVEDRDLADLDADSVQYAVVPIHVRVMRKSLEVPGMTSRKQTVETYFEGFRRKDHAMILDLLTDEVVWDLPGFRHLQGKEAFDGEIENEQFVGKPTLRMDRMVEEGDVVVAIGDGEATHASGTTNRFAYCDVFTFSGDLIARVESYLVPLTGDAANG